eukprot:TRINITY_DN16249_c3_g1_i1.p1 TRINITY_DN16249_c3_g1~~TRINITY_DN16249_c3_g1_i1.p1  ORF type:complete len:104 (-),score=4.78 TRINITY_DN16249_c3_g1_i1:260-571(-)
MNMNGIMNWEPTEVRQIIFIGSDFLDDFQNFLKIHEDLRYEIKRPQVFLSPRKQLDGLGHKFGAHKSQNENFINGIKIYKQTRRARLYPHLAMAMCVTILPSL